MGDRIRERVALWIAPWLASSVPVRFAVDDLIRDEQTGEVYRVTRVPSPYGSPTPRIQRVPTDG